MSTTPPGPAATPSSNSVIRVVRAREHNLKDVCIDLPRDRLVVITGLSGSGKSSLAFDTIYQEGQRRFMESLSAYARQFLGQMEKPAVDRVDGLSPTLCIDQKTVNRNPRSTVGTITEILDHLRLLLARLGVPHCPECNREIRTLSPGQIADRLLAEHADARLVVLAPIVQDRKGEYRKELSDALAQGFLRARIDGVMRELDDPGSIQLGRYEKHTIELVIDRLLARPDNRVRLIEAVEQALARTGSQVAFLVGSGDDDLVHLPFNSERACPDHGISIPEMEPRLFSFNAPQGMCPDCSGIGWTEDFSLAALIDADAPVVTSLRPLQDRDRLPFTTLSRDVVALVASQLGVVDPQVSTWRSLSPTQKLSLLHGAPIEYVVERDSDGRHTVSRKTWAGLLPIVKQVWQYTGLSSLRQYRDRQDCDGCGGRRLNPVSLAVTFRGRNVADLSAMSVGDARAFFDGVAFDGEEARIGAPIIKELRGRLAFLDHVGLGYLGIDRSAATLSGGEGQRIRLASQVGAGLQGVTYVLDEPSIGLHPRDQDRLLDALAALRDRGNSVLVVEHDPATMARADHLVEIGPGAGRAGGQVIAEGPPAAFLQSDSLTARYLSGRARIRMPATRRAGSGLEVLLRGARGNNLNSVDFRLPLGTFTVVTGVSGSGKSTLVMDTLLPALQRLLSGAGDRPAPFDGLDGVEHIDKVVPIDQAPIGRTPRSNPATYTGAFDLVRDLYAKLPESRARGWPKGRFSFNVAGGRCEECQGAGLKTVEMQFLADVEVPCETCGGRRFNEQTLEVRYRGKSITDVLDMTIGEAVHFFSRHKKLHRMLETLDRVGLGYVALGQPSTTLSGGEAQRVKLATELQRPSTGRTLYLLDEPTTGLHTEDVRRLLGALQGLVDGGNTVLVIEHSGDVVKVADHVIDLGPEGGTGGGQITATGTPEQVALTDSPTGLVLRQLLAQERRLDLREAAAAVADVAAVDAAGLAARPLLVADEALQWGVPLGVAQATQGSDLLLRGVRTHNLRGIDVDLPRGKMSVITGPSGSGKSSLAFDTIFAEGQRRYVESLSTYARRFLGRMGKAPVDKVEGLAPAIAIDQRNGGSNPRSTVATVTEVYDSLRLLYARIGVPHCPACAREVIAWSASAAARHLQALNPGGGRLVAGGPGFLLPADMDAAALVRDGFVRLWRWSTSEEVELDGSSAANVGGCSLVVDRIDPHQTSRQRLAEAVGVAYGYGADRACFLPRDGSPAIVLTRAAECPDHGRVLLDEVTPRHFSFNAHVGACPGCDGLGRKEAVDPALLFPSPHLKLVDAIDGRAKQGLLKSKRNQALVQALFKRHGMPASTPVTDWPPALRRALLYGSDSELDVNWSRTWGSTKTKVSESRNWPGMVPLIDGWAGRATWLRQETECSDCQGQRLRPEVRAVTLGARPGEAPADTPGLVPLDAGRQAEIGPPGLSIGALCALTVQQARVFWGALRLDAERAMIAEQAVSEVQSKLAFLDDVGLGYLTLDRAADSLSGGEAQRIRLATQLGSRLTGVIYVLDEPTIGLHPRDTERLLGTLHGLRDLGNTLVVVEHDPAVMRAADHLLDLGPGAGEYGGQVMAQGTPAQVEASGCLTGQYLSGTRAIPRPQARRKAQGWLESPASHLHNLSGVSARLPLGCLSVVTGVSGSGKSTLIMDVLAPWLREQGERQGTRKGFRKDALRLVEVDQKPIGRTPRSTPATYAGLLDPIRALLAGTPLARENGWGPGRFSFNAAEGRCVHCEGRGALQVEMHFLSDVWVPCEHCGGRRFDEQTLRVRWKGLNIADILELSVDEATEHFAVQRSLHRRLSALAEVGLGYLRLGQPATELSGGEAQRMKLAVELAVRSQTTCYLLDEPTTGLHFGDVEKLLVVLHKLVDQGHTVVLIEHHLDVIDNADHVVDMGPEGGKGGGRILATGTPEELSLNWEKTGSWTGRALAQQGGGRTPSATPAPAAAPKQRKARKTGAG
jgi:excinuclease ABC subunit A